MEALASGLALRGTLASDLALVKIFPHGSAMKLKTLALSLLLGLAATFAFAEDRYLVRVPANVNLSDSTPETPAEPLALILSAEPLPAGMVGAPYEFNLLDRLSITGGTGSHNYSDTTWSLKAGDALPPGLAIEGDKIVGVPTMGSSESFQFNIFASYSSSFKESGFSIKIDNEPLSIVLSPLGYRYWSDGSFGKSCHDYMQRDGGVHYSGQNGNGIYRIRLENTYEKNVFCDMSTGGYTLVGRAVANTATTTWAGAVGGINIPSSPSPSSPTFKYSDEFINAIPKTVYKVRSTLSYATTRYWSGACTYVHNVASASESCFTSYANEDMTDDRRTGDYDAQYSGLHDRISNTGGLKIGTTYLVDPSRGWVGGDGTTWERRGTGASGSLITFDIWVK